MKKVFILLVFLLVIMFSSCSLNITSFEEKMVDNDYYVSTLSQTELNIIYDKYLSDTKKYERNSLPIVISIVSNKEISLDVTEILNKTIDYNNIFDESFIGIVVGYSNIVNAEVAWGVKDELIKSIKENNDIKNDYIFNLNIKKIGSSIFYGTDEFINLVTE